MPAESISKRSVTPLSAATRRNTPSAIGERQILPRQTKSRRCFAMRGEMACESRRRKAGRGGDNRRGELAAAAPLSYFYAGFPGVSPPERIERWLLLTKRA